MPKNFHDLLQEFSPERKQKIEQRFQELRVVNADVATVKQEVKNSQI